MGEECLDPVHRQLLQHYASLICSQRQNGGSGTFESNENRAHGSEERHAAEDSCSGVNGGRSDVTNRGAAECEAVVVAAANGERARDTEIETAAEIEIELEAEEAAANHSWLSSPPGGEQNEEREAIQTVAVASPKISSSGDTSSGGDSGEDSENDEEDSDATATSASSSSGDTSSSSSGSSDGQDSEDDENNEDDDDDDSSEDRPIFEPIVDGVTISASVTGPGSSSGDCDGGDGGSGLEMAVSVEQAAQTAAASALLVHEPKGETYTTHMRNSSAAIEDPKEIRKLILGSSSSISTTGSDNHDRNDSCSKDTGQHRQEQHHQALHRGTSPLPRPVLAGPAATEVAVTLGDERGVGFCAATARKNLMAARKARERSQQGSNKTVSDGGPGTTSSSTATPNTAAITEETIKTSGAPVVAARGQQALAVEASNPASTASKKTPAASPSRRGNSPPRGGPTPTTTASVRENQAPRRSSSDDNTPPPLPPSALGELLRTLVDVDAAGGGGADKRARDRIESRSPISKSSAGFGGGAVTDWSVSGTAGARRQGRARAMEDAKRIASDMTLNARGHGGEIQEQRARGVSGADSMNPSSSSSLGEIIAVVLRLTDDADFKIVRRKYSNGNAPLQYSFHTSS